MKNNPAASSRMAVTVLAFIAYPLLSHFSTVALANSIGGVVLALAPLLTVAVLATWGTRWRIPTLGLTGLLLCALLWHLPQAEQHFSWIYFIQNAGTNAALGLAFGATLFAARQPMCTRIALLLGQAPSPALLRYTRHATIAWCGFFSGITLSSTLLFIAAPLWLWSTFANLLYFPLLGLMFAGEFAVRRRALPGIEHGSLSEAIRSAINSIKHKSTP
jgi:uncharacterized membrane protein